MDDVNIDTHIHEATDHLREAGFSQEQAHAFTKAVTTINAGLLSHLKGELHRSQADLKKDLSFEMERSRSELEAKIDRTRSELEARIERSNRITLYQMICLFAALASLPLLSELLANIFD